MRRLTNTLSGFARYYDEVVEVNHSTQWSAIRPVSNRVFRRLFLLNGNLNTDRQPELLLKKMHGHLGSGDMVVAVISNSYYHYLFSLLRSLFGKSPVPVAHHNFLTRRGLEVLARMAGLKTTGFIPVQRLGWLRWIPLVRWSSHYTLALLRKDARAAWQPTVSVVVPVRNEKGNLEKIFLALSKLRGLPNLEVIFVEGGSSDGTFEHLQRLLEKQHPFKVQLLQQFASGKADAVRLGFSKASNELLMILDGDLSVDPTELLNFYDSYCQDQADLLVGTRLLFPFESGAMRPLNFLGNLFFTKIVNYFLGLGLTDLLCGTKAIARADYQRIRLWKQRYQFQDPFGDFELIFGAALIGLRIGEVPVHYRARTYGKTNIRRFRDGFRLLKMTLQAAVLRG
jgi:hypothetical protein